MQNLKSLSARLESVQAQIDQLNIDLENLERDKRNIQRRIRQITPVSMPDEVVTIPPGLSEKRKRLQKSFIFLTGNSSPAQPGRMPLKALLGQIRGVLGEVRRQNELITDEKMTDLLIGELENMTNELEENLLAVLNRIKSEDF